jgi:hypothetical protein
LSKVLADAGGTIPLGNVLTISGGNYYAPSSSIVKQGEHFGANNVETGTCPVSGGSNSNKRAFVGR